MSIFRTLLAHLWGSPKDSQSQISLAYDYEAIFSSEQGQRVLQHMFDSDYCTVYEGSDPVECMAHNARRMVVHNILLNIDLARNLRNNPQPKEDDSGA